MMPPIGFSFNSIKRSVDVVLEPMIDTATNNDLDHLSDVPYVKPAKPKKKPKVKRVDPRKGLAEDEEINYDEMCPICLWIMVEPFKLKCGHFFCIQCIKKCKAQGFRKCPMCRQYTFGIPMFKNRRSGIDKKRRAILK